MFWPSAGPVLRQRLQRGGEGPWIITRRQGPTDEHVIKTGAMPGTVAGEMEGRKIDWVQVVQRSGEIMLAFGAIFRVLGEYLEDRQRVAKEDERDIAQRL